MHNPVPSKKRILKNLPFLSVWAVAAFVAFCGFTASVARSQEVEAAPYSLRESRDLESKIIAHAKRGVRIEIDVAPRQIGGASGTVFIEGKEWRTTTDRCPGLIASLDRWRALPQLRLGPLDLVPDVSADFIPPGRLDGGGPWTIETIAYTSDWQRVKIVMEDGTTSFVDWAEFTVRAIRHCAEDQQSGVAGS